MMDKGDRAAFEKNHPFAPYLHLGKDMAADARESSGEYMRLIFGGAPPRSDVFDYAYRTASLSAAQSQTSAQPLAQQSELAFVPGARADKDSLLQTFQQQRVGESDLARSLSSRVTHTDQLYTFYGKRYNRFHKVRGGQDLLYRSSDPGFAPQWNLSSRTSAPTAEGGFVPHFVVEPPQGRPAFFAELSASSDATQQDMGAYFGDDTSQFAQERVTSEFLDNFRTLKLRR